MSRITLGTVVAHCAYCGHAIDPSAPASERFGEHFCSEAHAEQFAEGVRSARIGAAARRETAGRTCSLPPVGQRHWKDYLKRGACWGAPLLLLLAIPLFWTGSVWGATGRIRARRIDREMGEHADDIIQAVRQSAAPAA
jgi:hypothetical protein